MKKTNAISDLIMAVLGIFLTILALSPLLLI